MSKVFYCFLFQGAEKREEIAGIRFALQLARFDSERKGMQTPLKIMSSERTYTLEDILSFTDLTRAGQAKVEKGKAIHLTPDDIIVHPIKRGAHEKP